MFTIKNEDDELSDFNPYCCPNCHTTNDEVWVRFANKRLDPTFRCYNGFGIVHYHIMPWYCKTCEHVFVTCTCERELHIFKNLLKCFMVGLMLITPFVINIVGNKTSDSKTKLISLLAAVILYPILVIALSEKSYKNEPKNMDQWINNEIKKLNISYTEQDNQNEGRKKLLAKRVKKIKLDKPKISDSKTEITVDEITQFICKINFEEDK